MLTILFLLAACALPGFAAAPGGFTIEAEGDLVAGGQVYRSSVTLTLTPENPEDTMLIQDGGGIWMELAPDPSGTCTVRFAQQRSYRLRFCAQAPDGTRGTAQAKSFVINSGLASLIEDSRSLPDLYTATDAQVEQAREQILQVRSRYNDLPEDLRALVPEAQSHRISALTGWLNNMLPGMDVLPPESPSILLTGDKAPGADVYAGEVAAEIQPANARDIDMICIRTQEIWQYIEPDNGVYRIAFSQPGSYSFDICARDAAGNCSPAQSVSFSIDPQACAFLKLSAQAQGVQAEQALLDYHALTTAQRARVGVLAASRLQTLCRWQYDAHRIVWEGSAEGRPVQTVGMLAAFPAGNAGLTISGAPGAQQIPGMAKNALYAYDISFTGGTPAQPVLFRAALPPVLLQKQEVQVYGPDGVPVQTRIKSEDKGMVLEFFVQQPGRYLAAADPIQEE